MGKTRRFGDLVRLAGRPEVVALWTAPEANNSFMKAVKENRVLTVIQEPTSKKKDFGEIGFHQGSFSSYLVFPRSLPKEEPRRVIGINYELIEEPESGSAPAQRQTDISKSRIPRTPKPRTPKAPPPKPEREFKFKLRQVAISERVVPFKATDRETAKRRAQEWAENEPFHLESAAVRKELKAVR